MFSQVSVRLWGGGGKGIPLAPSGQDRECPRPLRQDRGYPPPSDRLHPRRYASCGHAGGLSCFHFVFNE